MEKAYDVVIIGAGPAGLFAALELGSKQINTLIIDKGKNIGGVAFQTDVNLQDYNGISKKNNLGNRLFNSRAKANYLISLAFKYLYKFGLQISKPKNANFEDFKKDDFSYEYHDIFPVSRKQFRKILKKMKIWLQEHNATFCLNAEVINIKRGKNKNWVIRFEKNSDLVEVESRFLVVASGKLSFKTIIEKISNLKYKKNSKICIGFRLEDGMKPLSAITNNCLNPKIKINKIGMQTECHCWCAGGGIISYDFFGAKILDGKHIHSKKSKNTSFGIITTIELPRGSSNIDFGINYAKYISSIGNGKVLLQRLRDMEDGNKTTKKLLLQNNVKPSLTNFELVDFNMFIPSVVINRTIGLIDCINKVYGRIISDNCLIYAPVVERFLPIMDLNGNFESNLKNIFIVGDCSGKSIGAVPAAITGLAAAKHIISEVKC